MGTPRNEAKGLLEKKTPEPSTKKSSQKETLSSMNKSSSRWAKIYAFFTQHDWYQNDYADSKSAPALVDKYGQPQKDENGNEIKKFSHFYIGTKHEVPDLKPSNIVNVFRANPVARFVGHFWGFVADTFGVGSHTNSLLGSLYNSRSKVWLELNPYSQDNTVYKKIISEENRKKIEGTGLSQKITTHYKTSFAAWLHTQSAYVNLHAGIRPVILTVDTVPKKTVLRERRKQAAEIDADEKTSLLRSSESAPILSEIGDSDEKSSPNDRLKASLPSLTKQDMKAKGRFRPNIYSLKSSYTFAIFALTTSIQSPFFLLNYGLRATANHVLFGLDYLATRRHEAYTKGHYLRAVGWGLAHAVFPGLLMRASLIPIFATRFAANVVRGMLGIVRDILLTPVAVSHIAEGLYLKKQQAEKERNYNKKTSAAPTQDTSRDYTRFFIKLGGLILGTIATVIPGIQFLTRSLMVHWKINAAHVKAKPIQKKPITRAKKKPSKTAKTPPKITKDEKQILSAVSKTTNGKVTMTSGHKGIETAAKTEDTKRSEDTKISEKLEQKSGAQAQPSHANRIERSHSSYHEKVNTRPRTFSFESKISPAYDSKSSIDFSLGKDVFNATSTSSGNDWNLYITAKILIEKGKPSIPKDNRLKIATNIVSKCKLIDTVASIQEVEQPNQAARGMHTTDVSSDQKTNPNVKRLCVDINYGDVKSSKILEISISSKDTTSDDLKDYDIELNAKNSDDKDTEVIRRMLQIVATSETWKNKPLHIEGISKEQLKVVEDYLVKPENRSKFYEHGILDKIYIDNKQPQWLRSAINNAKPIAPKKSFRRE